MLIKDGIPTAEDLASVMPSEERLARGPVAITECFQNIACNPCVAACPQHAISMEPDINATPKVDPEACIGCRLCVKACPGLAIFVVDMSGSGDTALVTLPYEFLPVPKKGDFVRGLNRAGEEQGLFEVKQAVSGGKKNLTWMITLEVPKALAMEVRNIKADCSPEGGDRDGR